MRRGLACPESPEWQLLSPFPEESYFEMLLFHLFPSLSVGIEPRAVCLWVSGPSLSQLHPQPQLDFYFVLKWGLSYQVAQTGLPLGILLPQLPA